MSFAAAVHFLIVPYLSAQTKRQVYLFRETQRLVFRNFCRALETFVVYRATDVSFWVERGEKSVEAPYVGLRSGTKIPRPGSDRGEDC